MAVTFFVLPMVSEHAALVVKAAQSPPQPLKLEPLLAAAVSVTGVLASYVAAAQGLPLVQLMPEGLLLTEPLPVPVRVAFREYVASKAEQFAVEPPLEPVQLQAQGPLPVTAPAVPDEQRFELGAVLNA